MRRRRSEGYRVGGRAKLAIPSVAATLKTAGSEVAILSASRALASRTASAREIAQVIRS
jgi:hypothetical protein